MLTMSSRLIDPDCTVHFIKYWSNHLENRVVTYCAVAYTTHSGELDPIGPAPHDGMLTGENEPSVDLSTDRT